MSNDVATPPLLIFGILHPSLAKRHANLTRYLKGLRRLPIEFLGVTCHGLARGPDFADHGNALQTSSPMADLGNLNRC